MSATKRIDWLFESALLLGSLGIGSAAVGSTLWLSDTFESSAEAAEVTAAPIPTATPLDFTTSDLTPSDSPVPLRIHIPDIDVEAEIIDLGLNPDRSLEVPQNYEQTGWYTGGSIPGDRGPSIIAGHVDSRSGPAVFFRLNQLEAGDVVFIDRSDGLTARYRITRTTDVDKSEFPTSDVYGSTEEPTLRLITCGGTFDHDVRSYTGNVVVFAEHLGNVPTARTAQPDR